MINNIKINIESIKRIAGIAASAIILAVTVIILLNIFTVPDGSGLSDAENLVNHFINKHKVNDVSFGFIKFNFDHKYYSEKKSGLEMNTIAAVISFLISSGIIFYNHPKKKFLYAEIFPFVSNFKSSLFRPPKYLD